MPRKRKNLGLSDISGRRRWTAAQARDALKRLAESGLSVREFAERRELDRQRLYRWRAALATPSSTKTAAFIEIKARTSATIEVVLRSGAVVRVPDGFSADTLRRVVAAVDGAGEPC
jgi:transposase-like protein